MTYYRYDDGPWFDDEYNHTDLQLTKYEVLKETPCGVWIKFPERDKYSYDPLKYIQGKKFILEKSKWYKTITNKRFAWPTKDLALISYIARKEKQIIILEYQLDNAKLFLTKAKNIQNDNSISN